MGGTRTLVAAWEFVEHPAFAYNALTLALAAVGVVLGAWGLWLARVQIRKTLAAAEAAREAAARTAAEMHQVIALVGAYRLSALSGEVLHLIRSDDLRPAAIRLQDLHAGVVELRHSPKGPAIQTDAEWQEMVTQICAVLAEVEEADRPGGGYTIDRPRCLAKMSRVDARLRGMGVSVAHPRET